MLLLRGLLGFAIVVGFFVFLARRYWRGRDRFEFVRWWRRRKMGVPQSQPREPVDPLTLFDDVRIERIGELDVPTGTLVACDPLAGPDHPPLARTIAPGRYPVDVSVIEIEPGHRRVGAMRLVVGTGQPVRWEEAGSYGVDAGVGCFMDVAAQELLVRESDRVGALQNGNYYDDVLAKELENPSRDWTDHYPVPGRNENVIITHSGWGDGIYLCYWVLDGSGTPVWLVPDFEV